jgi:ABC-2 type transport system permease protein
LHPFAAEPGRREWVQQAARASGYFDQLRAVASVTDAVRAGQAQVGVDWLASGQPRLIADASDPAATRPATLALAIELQRVRAQTLAPMLDTSAPPIEWLHNPDARTSWSLTPALIGVVVMISTLLLGALTLVREREQGTWEALLATSIDGTDALLGKLGPYVIAGLAQALIVAGVAHAAYGVPFSGSLAALTCAAVLFAATHLLVGFALSAVAATQLQAIQSAVFFYLPAMLLSGFMFPFQGMPRWAQLLGECLPLTHFVRIARGVMLRGEQLEQVMPELWPIAAFGALAGALALAAYRRHL